jgi:hypothetical protein
MRIIALFAAAVVVCAWLGTSAAEPEKKPAPPDYKRDIAPILEMKCNRCHTEKKAGGKLITTSPAAMIKGGASGPAIEPGKPDTSLIVELIFYNEMPPKPQKPRVTAEELKLLKAWIAAGAPEK